MRSLDWLGAYRWSIARLRPSVAAALEFVLVAVSAAIFGANAEAGVITYTFGAPNNNAGTMAIGYPLEPVIVNGMAGYLADYPANNMGIITFTSAPRRARP